MWYDTNEMLEELGYGPNARKQRMMDDLGVLVTAAKFAAVGYGVSKAAQAVNEHRQNVRQASAEKQESANMAAARQAQAYTDWRNKKIAEIQADARRNGRKIYDTTKPVTR